MLHLVIDVFMELYKFIEKIPYDLIYISAIGSTLDSSISILKRHILCGHGPKFGWSTKNLGPFLSRLWMDGVLRWRNNNNVEVTYHPMYHGWIFDWEDTLEESKMMGATYLQAIVDSLNKRFLGWLVFNTSQLPI